MNSNWFDYSMLFDNKKIDAVFSYSSFSITDSNYIKNFASASGFNPENLIIPDQTHSKNVEIVNKSGHIENCDGVFSMGKELICSLKVADCMPIFFVHKYSVIFGLVHVGWKGLVKGIISVVGTKLLENNLNLSEFQILIGPSIHSCCFEVDHNIIHNFEQDFLIKKLNDKYSISLQLLVKKQLFDIGFIEENIILDNQCTSCNDKKFYSYRRDNKNTGRMIALLGFRN